MADLQNSTISRIEADSVDPDIATLNKIADALNVERTLLLAEFGYANIQEDFLVIARKAGELSEEQREKIYKTFNETIDKFLDNSEN